MQYGHNELQVEFFPRQPLTLMMYGLYDLICHAKLNINRTMVLLQLIYLWVIIDHSGCINGKWFHVVSSITRPFPFILPRLFQLGHASSTKLSS